MTAILGHNVLDVYSQASGNLSGRLAGLGDRYVDWNGNEYLYAQASGAISAGQVCQITSAYAATPVTTANSVRGSLIGVARADFTTSDFGWFQVKGPTTFSVLASAVLGVRLNTTATAGSIDDDGTVGAKQVQGIYLTTTNGGSTAVVAGILNYPFVDVTL